MTEPTTPVEAGRVLPDTRGEVAVEAADLRDRIEAKEKRLRIRLWLHLLPCVVAVAYFLGLIVTGVSAGPAGILVAAFALLGWREHEWRSETKAELRSLEASLAELEAPS